MKKVDNIVDIYSFVVIFSVGGVTSTWKSRLSGHKYSKLILVVRGPFLYPQSWLHPLASLRGVR